MSGLFRALGDAIHLPVSFLPPAIGIIVLAVLVSAGSLLVFKWTSDQEKIRRGKGRLKADLLAIWLFRHDLRLVVRSLFGALFHSFANLRFLALPMAVMLLPLLIVFVQLDLRYGFTGIAPGGTSILSVHLQPGADAAAVAIDAPDGVALDSPGVRVRDAERGLFEVDFRLRGVAPGDHDLVIRTAGGEATKRVTVGPGPSLFSPVRDTSGPLALLFAPGEPGLPGDGDVERIEIAYASATYPFLGIDWAWWTLFLVAMILALFALRTPLGVDF